jgi:hypothetical protein
MSIQMTDQQIVRVLELCERIARIKNELPAAPRGFEVGLEIAKALRSSIEAQNDALTELAALLR